MILHRILVGVLGLMLPLPLPSVASSQVDTVSALVVRNTKPISTAVPWRLGMPSLALGGGDGNDEQSLFNVIGAIRLPDGSVLIANAGNHELLLFDQDGSLIGTVGGQGEGPGEFRGIARMERMPGDSILVFDGQLHRVALLSASLDLGWERRITPPSRRFSSVGRFDDGRWFAVENSQILGGTRGTLTPDTVGVLFFDEDLRTPVPGPRLPGTIGAAFTGIRGEVGRMAAPFSPHPVFANLGDCLSLSVGDGFDIAVYQSDGEIVKVIQNAWERVPATSEDLAAWVEERMVRVPEEVKPAMRSVLLEVPTPNHLPAYNAMIPDALGFLWAQRYEAPDGFSRKWAIFHPGGDFLGTLELPRDLEVFEIGEDYLVGMWKDRDDQGFVGVFPLFRSGLSPTGERLCPETR